MPRRIVELATQTGGRIFDATDPPAAIDQDLALMQCNVRSLYRLVYKPASRQHDGSFHHIELSGPDRLASIQAPSGYYALSH